jgi:hypothetical protein
LMSGCLVQCPLFFAVCHSMPFQQRSIPFLPKRSTRIGHCGIQSARNWRHQSSWPNNRIGEETLNNNSTVFINAKKTWREWRRRFVTQIWLGCWRATELREKIHVPVNLISSQLLFSHFFIK